MQGSRPDTIGPAQSTVFSYQRWRENFLRLVLIGATILGFVAALLSAVDVVRSGTPALAFVYGGAWLVLFLITILPWPYPVRVAVMLALLYGVAVSGLLENGMRGDARLFFLGLTIMTAMLVGMRAALAAAAGSLVTIAAGGTLVLTGTVKLLSKTTAAGSPGLWLVSSLDLVLLQTIVLTGLYLFLREFTVTQERVARSVEDLARERTLLRTVIDNLPDAVYAKDASGRRELANQADADLLGVARAEDALGRTGAESLPEESAARLIAEDREVLRTGRALINQEVWLPGSDGRSRWLLVSKLPLRSASGEILGMVGIDRDITGPKRAEQERAALEEQLRVSQRLESMGRLAGGLAHDINNLLLPILGYTELLLADLPTGESLKEGLQQIKGAAERTRELSRKLLAFGRGQALRLVPVNLRDTVDSFGMLLRHTVRDDVGLELRLPHDLGFVRVDASALEQILMNLVMNAQEAMPAGGTLTIEAKEQVYDEAEARLHPGLSPGAYVLLQVSDTGVGMDPGTAARIFEPFFTTKSRGTGLGLSTTHGLVHQHGGTIEVSSKPGVGTTFTVFLPRAAAPATEAPAAEGREENLALRGGETVLVVDDSDAVREMVSKGLARLGYRVLTAGSAEEALTISSSKALSIDLLITDVVMPVMDGVELSRRLRLQRAGIGVLFISGYGREAAARRGVVGDGMTLLTKPFLLEDLARAVRTVLGTRVGPSAPPSAAAR